MSKAEIENGTLRVFGVALAAVAVGATIARYVWLPLTLEPEWLRTVFTGGGPGLIIGGVMIARRVRGPLPVVTAVIVGAIAAGAGAMSVRALVPPPPDTAPLHPESLAGLDISLPAWPERDVTHLGGRGRVVVALSHKQGNLHVEWSQAGVLPIEELKQIIGRSFGAIGSTQTGATELPIGDAGERAPVATATLDGQLASAMTSWRCPDGPTIAIGTVLQQPLEVTVALHGRVLASIRCRPDTRVEGVLKLLFEPPDGYALGWDDGDGRGYLDEATGEMVALYPLQPDPHFTEQLASVAPVRGALIGMMADDAKSKPAPSAASLPKGAGLWAFGGSDRETGDPIQGLLTAWPCSKQGGTAIAIYANGSDGPLEPGVAVLARARCP